MAKDSAHGCGIPSAVVVVAAGFCINGIYNGVFFVSGLYLTAFMDTFNAGKVTTAWVVSLHGCFAFFSGLVAGPLITQFGTRKVAVAGSLCSTVGLLLSAFAVHISWLYVSYGLLTSFGFGILMITNGVCVQQHTRRRRALAAGLALSGTGAGTIIMPHLVRWAMDAYGWRGSLLILAGMLLHTLPCALLLRPPKPTKPDTQLPEPILEDAKLAQLAEKGPEVHKLLVSSANDINNRDAQSKSSMKQGLILPSYNQMVSNSSLGGSLKSVNQRLDLNLGTKSSINRSMPSLAPVDSPILCSPLVYSSTLSMNKAIQQESTHNYGQLHKTRSSQGNSSNAKSITKLLRDTMVPTRGETLSINFILVVVMSIGAYFFWIAGLPVVYVFCAVKAESIGLSPADSAMFLSLCGLGELVGRMLGAFLGTCHEKMPLVIFSLNLLLSGLSCASVSACGTYNQMIIAILAFGITIGMVSSMCTTVVRDLVGIHHLSSVVSYAFAAGGIGYIFSIEILALIWEVTNTVFIPFLIGGGFLAAGGLLILAAKLTHSNHDVTPIYDTS